MRTVIVLLAFASALATARPAPQFRGETVTGGKVALKDLLKPERGLLVCFWATWCIPCMEELRMVAEKLKADPTLPIDVVTVNVDLAETSSDVRPMISQQKISFPVILDPKHDIFSRYQQAKALPFSALVDSSGNIVKTFEGLQEDMFKTVRTVLKTPHAD